MGAARDAKGDVMESDVVDVEISNVTKRFGSFTAVNNMNLSIRRGEFFSLLGPSGCGKTTTLRMLAGFEQPSEGEIFLAGSPVAGVPPYKRLVNTVFQSYALFPHLDVWANVAFGLKRRRVPEAELKQRVQAALEMVEMEGMSHRRPGQLSGGQQQRVALARALVNRPMLLLLDEPLGALDAKLRKAMQLELKKLQSEVGITFVYVTHDQEEALTMSDRIAVMSNGSVEQIGTPEQIYENPSSAFVANFIGVSNVYPARIEKVDAGVATCVTDHGLVVRVSVTGKDLSTGDAVGVVIRPEKLLLLSEEEQRASDNRVNVYNAVVKSAVYIGSVTQLVVDIEGKHLAQVLQQNLERADRGQWRPGEQVAVSCGLKSCSMITDVEGGMSQKDLMGEVVKRV